MDIQNIINNLNKQITQLHYGHQPDELYRPIEYMMQLGGKRMRPLLTILGYYLFEESIEKVFKPAIGVEIFHNFTLMHDDIMDKAPLRRGKPTVHHQWNENIAILSGDVMLVRAYESFLDVDDQYLKKVIRKFNQCAAEVCEGQQWDMNFETQPAVTEGEYLEMIRLKTAVLLGFALELGGILAGQDEETTNLLQSFGENIGIGFQLKDDLLDVYGDAEKFGKQVGGDILANKKTFLLIKALENATDSNAQNLQYWLNAQKFDPEQKIREIIVIYNQLNVKQLTEAKISTYFTKAFQNLDEIKALDSKKAVVRNFVQQLLARES